MPMPMLMPMKVDRANGRRRSNAAALLVVLLASCASATASSNVAPATGQTDDGRVLLRRVWRPGEVLRSRIVVQSTAQVAGGPPVVVTSDSSSSQTVLELGNDGTALIEERQSAIRMRGADGQLIVDPQSAGMENVVFRYRVTARGEIVGMVDAQGTTDGNRQFVNGIIESIVQAATTFPEHPVALGESWREERPIVRHTEIGTIRMVRRAVWTFHGIELRQGRRVARLGFQFQIAAEPVSVPGGSVRAGGSGHGAVEHDVGLGRPMTSTVDSTVVTQMSMPSVEMSITVRTELQSSVID